MAAQPQTHPAQTTLPPNLGGPPPDIASLDSIKFRVTQLIDSIQTLAWQLEAFHQPPPWPDLLAKYAVVMAQTHNLSRALASNSALANTALHPRAPLADASLDGALIPLLRNQQTTDVLHAESASVRRLGAALKLPEDAPPHAVLQAVSEVVVEHDARAERAQRAVAMLREKYDWRVRVAVDPDEVWGDDEGDDVVDDNGTGEAHVAPKAPDSPASANTSEEEEELEHVLGPGIPNSDHEHEYIQMVEG
jgi:Mediator of RNA polymerase II transcription complex subunit 8